MEKINVGLIGCGRIANKHMEALKAIENANVIAFCDINEERLRNFTEKYRGKAYTNYKDLLNNPEINAVIIGTPSGLHAQMTIDAANAKKHVATEKPMALNLKDADAMVQACKKNNVKLCVIKQNRYNPPIVKLKEAFDKGRFGKIFLIKTDVFWARPQSYYDQDEWRGTWAMDGGVIMNQASHHLDLVRWFGGEIDSVFSTMNTFSHNIEVDDTHVGIIKFKNGAMGIINATTCTFPKNIEGSLTILGTKGSAKVGGFAVNKMEHWDFSDYNNDDESITKHSTVPSNVYGFGHIEVFRNFIGAIITDKNLSIDGLEGRKTLELIKAMYLSAKTGKEIKLPLENE